MDSCIGFLGGGAVFGGLLLMSRHGRFSEVVFDGGEWGAEESAVPPGEWMTGEWMTGEWMTGEWMTGEWGKASRSCRSLGWARCCWLWFLGRCLSGDRTGLVRGFGTKMKRVTMFRTVARFGQPDSRTTRVRDSSCAFGTPTILRMSWRQWGAFFGRIGGATRRPCYQVVFCGGAARRPLAMAVKR